MFDLVQAIPHLTPTIWQTGQVVTTQKIHPQIVKCCHSKVPKSIHCVLLVATSRFLPGLKRILSLWVPLIRLNEFIWAEDLIRTRSYFSLALSLRALLSFISSLWIFFFFCTVSSVLLNEFFSWSDELKTMTQDRLLEPHRKRFWRFRNDCWSQSQIKQNDCSFQVLLSP